MIEVLEHGDERGAYARAPPGELPRRTTAALRTYSSESMATSAASCCASAAASSFPSVCTAACAHVRIQVLEHGEERRLVLRERRRVELPERLHRRLLAASILGVLEHGDERGRVLRERRRVELPQRLTAAMRTSESSSCRRARVVPSPPFFEVERRLGRLHQFQVVVKVHGRMLQHLLVQLATHPLRLLGFVDTSANVPSESLSMAADASMWPAAGSSWCPQKPRRNLHLRIGVLEHGDE